MAGVWTIGCLDDPWTLADYGYADIVYEVVTEQSGSVFMARNGKLAVDLTRDGDGTYELSVTVPWNIDATVRFPEPPRA